MRWQSEGLPHPPAPAAPGLARRPQTARARAARPLRGLPECERPRPPCTPQPGSAPPSAPEETAADRLRAHLERLWEHSGVPECHRTLYAARYLQGGFPPEVLRREAKLLAAGTAPVQRAMRAVEAREELLSNLVSLRSRHDDAELRQRRGPARERLLEVLLALRGASAEAVEALCGWRRSVAPLPGLGPPAGGTDASGGTATGNSQAAASTSVASPGARGACWPFGADGEDYLWHMARDDSAVRAFEAVVELSPSCDPLLLHLGPTCPLVANMAAPGKLRLPPLESSRRERFETARMLLLEEQVALELISNKSGDTKNRAPACLGFGGAVTLTTPSPSPTPQAHSRTSAKWEDGHSPSKERPHARQRASTAPRKSYAVSTLAQKRRTAKLNKLASMLMPCTPGFRSSDESQEAVMRFFAQMGEQLRAQSRHRAQVSGTSTPRSGQCTPRRLSVASSRRGSGASLRRGSLVDRQRSLSPRASRGSPRPSISSRVAPRHRQSRAAVSPAAFLDLGVPAVDRPRIEAAFRRFAHDGLLHTDQLREALQRSGFPQPSEAAVEEAYAGVTSFTTMNLDEFSSIVMAYEARQRLSCLEIFRNCNPDGRESGHLNTAQLTDVLRKLDIDPMPHVLAEVVAEVDDDHNGQVNFREFYRLVVLLREHETFTRVEYEELLDLFHKFDHGSCAEMDTRDLHHALLYLGLRACVEEVEQFVSEIDADHDGIIDQSEFLYCIRRVRECELGHVTACMEVADQDKSGTISVPELPALLEQLGYYCPDERIISEVFEEVKDRMEIAENDELDIGGVWQFLRIFRMREGLSREEAAEVEEAFRRFVGQDTDSARDEVSKQDLPKVLHYLGYRTSFEEQLLLAAEVDIDNSGALCLGELRKLVRICREERLRAIKDSFDRFDIFGTGSLLPNRAKLALKNVPGFSEMPPDEEDMLLEAFEVDRRVTMREFMRIALQQDEAVRQKLRESQGYSSEELLTLKKRFQEFDTGRMGLVNSTDVVGLVIASSPSLASDPKLRPQLMDIIRKADAAVNGNLGFPEFLQLMHSVREMIQKEQFSRERQAMDCSGFSAAEVHQFRGIFLSWANEEQRLPRQVFQDMLAPLCPAGGRSAASLTSLWRRQFFDNTTGHDGSTRLTLLGCNAEEADFSQFLLLMRAVLDANLGNVVNGGRAGKLSSDFSQDDQQRINSLRRGAIKQPASASRSVSRRSTLRLSGGLGKWQSLMQSRVIS